MDVRLAESGRLIELLVQIGARAASLGRADELEGALQMLLLVPMPWEHDCHRAVLENVKKVARRAGLAEDSPNVEAALLHITREELASSYGHAP